MTTLLRTRYIHKAPFRLEAVGLDMPVVDGNQINRTPFSAILTRIDEPSTRPPNGSAGHLVQIPRAVAEAALSSLLGMGVDVAENFRDHAKQTKVGVITEAHIEGKDLVISGHLYEKDFPEEVAYIKENKTKLGASYEIADVSVEDTDAKVWTLTGLLFTGAAILRKDAAAYAKTAIAAQAEEEDCMAGEGTAILDELKKLNLQMDAARREDEEDEEDAAARKDEEDAKRREDDARKARDDDDEDAAKRHEEDASRLRLSAAKRHEDAARRRAEDAKKREDDADARKRADEDAKRHEEEARRLKVEDETARKRREEDQEDARARTDDEDAAGGTMNPAIFAMLLKAMGYGPARRKADAAARKGKPAQDDDEDDTDAMARLLGRMMLKGMSYPQFSPRSARRRADAAHDDEAEDRALFERLLKQHDKMDAGREIVSLDSRRLRRDIRDLQASIGLITDTLKKQTGLITDLVQQQKNLSTDQHRGANGGPVRRTMAATGQERWVGQFDGRADGSPVTMAQLDAALDQGGLALGGEANNVEARIARKIAAQMSGLVTTE
jgi:hypothetical protein